MAGFGRSRFGKGPFGRSDAGSDLIIKSFPENYFDDTLELSEGETPMDNDKDPLLKVLKTYAHQVSNRRSEIEAIHTLLDPEKMPLEIVRLWGDMLGLGIDKNDPEFLQRSFLANASQWLQLKASIPGYKVRGLASGFTVELINYWRIDQSYASLIPDRFKGLYKPKSSDYYVSSMLHTSAPPGSLPGLPLTEDGTYAKSAFLRLVFEVLEPRRENINYNTLFDLVVNRFSDVQGIHHEILPPVYQIRMNVDARQSTSWEIHEWGKTFASEGYPYYEVVSADKIATDHSNLSVSMMIANLMPVQVGASVEFIVEGDDESTQWSVSTVGTVVVAAQVVQTIKADAFLKFDSTAADVRALDGAGSVVMSVS